MTVLASAARRTRRVMRRARPVWRDARPLAILAGAVAVIVLGTIGYRSRGVPLLDAFYQSVGLFGWGGTMERPVPATLQIARILGPLVTGYAALRWFLALTHQQLRLLLFRLFLRDHVVVAGLGDKGFRAALALQDADRRVVVVERDPGNAYIPGCGERGIPVLQGDASDPSVLRRARAGQADHVLVVCGSDGTNIDVAVAAERLADGRGSGTLTALTHIEDRGLWWALSTRALEARHERFRLELFNMYAMAARMLLERVPPVPPADAGAVAPHVLVVGLDNVGEQLVLGAARAWRDARPAPGARLPVTIAGAGAQAAVLGLAERHPALERLCLLEARVGDPDSAWFREGGAMVGEDGEVDVTVAYVCLDDEGDALAAALALHGPAGSERVPVALPLADEATGVAGVLTVARRELRNIHPFGLHTRTLTPELLHEGLTEVLARAKHEQYVRDERLPDAAPNPSVRPWEELPDALKESNRRFADGIGVKLRQAGLVVVPDPLADPEDPGFAFDDAELEELARQEHDRWAADLTRDGWRRTTGPKDPHNRLHPSLVPWEQLSEQDRERDRGPVRELPAMLARAGLVVRAPARSASVAPEPVA